MNHTTEEWDFTKPPPYYAPRVPTQNPNSLKSSQNQIQSPCLLSSLISVLKSMIPTFNNKYLKYLFKNPEMETILPTHKAKKKNHKEKIKGRYL